MKQPQSHTVYMSPAPHPACKTDVSSFHGADQICIFVCMYLRFCQFYSHSVLLLIVCDTLAAPQCLHISSVTGMTF